MGACMIKLETGAYGLRIGADILVDRFIERDRWSLPPPTSEDLNLFVDQNPN